MHASAPEKAVGDQHTEKSIEAFKSTGQVLELKRRERGRGGNGWHRQRWNEGNRKPVGYG